MGRDIRGMRDMLAAAFRKAAGKAADAPAPVARPPQPAVRLSAELNRRLSVAGITETAAAKAPPESIDIRT